ncbi:MAG: peptidoglycan DD-metalloendopeptidase family protein [Oscillospiraceae bacterium]|jgi:murein DD-endopeptidase MepM/ murein hydrolase activator NlpD|nr:peptidoglycan DD-metalloendopeptidase family protein [Oscillospiraceae bacterium]
MFQKVKPHIDGARKSESSHGPQPIVCVRSFFTKLSRKRKRGGHRALSAYHRTAIGALFVVTASLAVVIAAAKSASHEVSLAAYSPIAQNFGADIAADADALIPNNETAVETVARSFALPENAARTEEVVTRYEMPYAVEVIYTDTEYVGTERVATEGVTGVREKTELKKYVGDTLVSTVLQSDVALVERVDEVVTIGTAERGASLGWYNWPMNKDTLTITSLFGSREAILGSTNHKGLDFNAYRGQSVFAADGGVVTRCETIDSYGKTVIITHDNGDRTLYGHLDGYNVRVGQRVSMGDVIGKAGNSGNATGVHLHFEIRPNGSAPVDPLPYLPDDNYRLVL